MRLFHGGSAAVPSPLPVSPEGKRPLDFGSGFYVTTSLEQARRWIGIRREQIPGFGAGVISCFEVDEEALMKSGLKIKRFLSTELDPWFDFVMANRHSKDFSHDCGISISFTRRDRWRI